MPKVAKFNPLQLFTPIQLVFCLILFFLPWIELTCTLPPEAAKMRDKAETDKLKKETGIDPSKPIGILVQSGLQIATGDSSPSSDFKKIEEQMKKEMGGMGAGGGKPEIGPSTKKDKEEGAPLLFLFPVALLAGIALGCVPWPNMVRKIGALACCLVAFGVVGLQAAIGFPIEKELKKQNEAMKGGGMFPGMPGGAAGGDTKGKSSAKVPDVYSVAYKIPLYLTFLLLLGAAGTSILGPGGMPSKKPKRRPYDFDDEEDEDDDRPRKKKKPVAEEDDEGDVKPAKKRRRDEEEEDEPRPKKRRRDEEEDEEEERPRKKPRRDEEEDEPPRKKKPAFEMPAAPPPPPPRPAAPSAPAGANPFAFGDEDEPPKKKPRRRDEDDEEDDRPRKKPRRRDDDD